MWVATLALIFAAGPVWADCKKDFDKASKKGTIAAYKEFLTKCSSGELGSQAKSRLRELEEARDWPTVASQNNPASYRTFVEKYPSGRFLDQALKGSSATEVDQKAMDLLLAENMLRSSAQNPRTAVYVGSLAWINDLSKDDFNRLIESVTHGESGLMIGLENAGVQISFLATGDQLKGLSYSRGSRLTTAAGKLVLLFDGSKWWRLQ
jgi:hypothetical protein